MYVIRREGGVFVTGPGERGSYTPFLQRARVFASREEADRARCPGNETVVSVEQAMEGHHA